MASANVRFVGPIYDPAALNGLYANCFAYLHGHEVGGTNPGLLRAMDAGACCVALDVAFNVEVLRDTGRFFAKDPAAIAQILKTLESEPDAALRHGLAARERACRSYRWDAVAAGYAELFRRLVAARKDKRLVAAAQATEVYHPERFASLEGTGP